MTPTSLRRVPDWVLTETCYEPPADLDVTPGPLWALELGDGMYARLVIWRAWSDARREWLDSHAPDVSHRALIAESRRRWPTVLHPTCPDTEVPATAESPRPAGRSVP